MAQCVFIARLFGGVGPRLSKKVRLHVRGISPQIFATQTLCHTDEIQGDENSYFRENRYLCCITLSKQVHLDDGIRRLSFNILPSCSETVSL